MFLQQVRPCRHNAYMRFQLNTFTDDILHARIQTMGVAEHIFDVGKLFVVF